MQNESGHSHGRLATVVAHTLFILIIFILPEVMFTLARPHRLGAGFFPGVYFKTFVYLSLFYINYFVLIGRTIGKSGRKSSVGMFLGSNLVLIAVGLLLMYIISKVCAGPPRGPRPDPGFWHEIFKSASFFLREAVMMVLSIGLAVAMKLSSKWHDIDRQRQEILAVQRTTELDNLKTQLNPHFLFNTLNTIYALVDINPDDAKGAIHRLSGLLRYMLYEDAPEVPLRLEAGFIEDYVALMRMRLSRREVKVDISIEAEREAPVPPLLFVPLVENAFKYGISGEGDTPIEISLRASGGRVECITRNSFAPLPQKTADEEKSSGIGLTNLRRRLVLIYGNEACLRTSVKDNIYTAHLSFPLK